MEHLHALLGQEVVAAFLCVDVQDQCSAQGHVQHLAAPADAQNREAGCVQRLLKQFQLQFIPLAADLPNRRGGIRAKGERRGVAAAGNQETVQGIQIGGGLLFGDDGDDYRDSACQNHGSDVVVRKCLPKLSGTPNVGIHAKLSIFYKIRRNADSWFHAFFTSMYIFNY